MHSLLPKYFKFRPIFGLTVAIALGGCAIGPDYFRPASTLPEAAPAVATAQVPVNPTWWTLFGDADLNALVDQTLTANQDLQAAIARLDAAEAAAREAGADYLPRIGLEASTGRSKSSGETFNGRRIGGATFDNNRAALTLSYELDLWGRIRRSNEAARAEALASRFGRDSLRLTLVGQVANEYLNLRSLDGQIEVTGQTLE